MAFALDPIYGHFFLYNLYIFVWIQHDCLANMVFALNPSTSVMKRLWCICKRSVFLWIFFFFFFFLLLDKLTFCAKPNTSSDKCGLLWLLSVDVSVPFRTSLLLRLLSVEVRVPLVLLPPKAEQFSKCMGFLLEIDKTEDDNQINA